MSVFELHCGDAEKELKKLEPKSIQCCVTSPPYYGLRDYGKDSQIGLEQTPEEYVNNLLNVFRALWTVLKDDGTLWLNLGDSYAGNSKPGGGDPTIGKRNIGDSEYSKKHVPSGLKPKDLIGIPWMVAFALRSEGWYLRSDIIWHKTNPMPEGVTDRPTKSHEYLFLLSKSAQYYYDDEAIKEKAKWSTMQRLSQNIEKQNGSDRVPGKTNGNMKAVLKNWDPFMAGGAIGIENRKHLPYPLVNKRDVWTVATHPFKEAHFATYPEKLIEPCILAGSRPGDIVIDPFNGAGTTGVVSVKHGRNYIGIDINQEYINMSKKRIDKANQQMRLF